MVMWGNPSRSAASVITVQRLHGLLAIVHAEGKRHCNDTETMDEHDLERLKLFFILFFKSKFNPELASSATYNLDIF